jgi:hypothetical protein
MGLYHPGYDNARKRVLEGDLDYCLSVCDDLQGRGNIEDEDDLDEVRGEALDQLREEFTDKTSSTYEQVQFWGKVHKAGGFR